MARSVVLSPGVQYRRLPVSRLREFEGAGVYYGATDVESRVCGANAVTVVGGGNSAGQAAVFLAEKGADVTLAIRGADLSSSMSTYLIDRIEASPKIRLVKYSEVTELHGDTRLEDVTITKTRRVFLCVSPASDSSPSSVPLLHQLARGFRGARCQGVRPHGQRSRRRRLRAVAVRNVPRGNLRGRRCPGTVDETCCRSGGRRFQCDSFGSSKARADDDLKV